MIRWRKQKNSAKTSIDGRKETHKEVINLVACCIVKAICVVRMIGSNGDQLGGMGFVQCIDCAVTIVSNLLLVGG